VASASKNFWASASCPAGLINIPGCDWRAAKKTVLTREDRERTRQLVLDEMAAACEAEREDRQRERQKKLDCHADLLGQIDYEACQLNNNNNHHFICPIIQQYAHLHEYDSRRAGQQGPIRTLTAALKRVGSGAV